MKKVWSFVTSFIVSQKKQSEKSETKQSSQGQQQLYLAFFQKGKQITQQHKLYPQKTLRQHLQSLQNAEKIQGNRLKFYINRQQSQQKIQILQNQLLQKIIQKNNDSYVINVQKYIAILMDDKEVKQFLLNTNVIEILSHLKIRSKDFYFFANFKEYTNPTADQDLQLHQCQLMNVKFLAKTIKAILIPIKIQVCNLINFIPFQKNKMQKIETSYISKIKIDSKQYILNQNKSIQDILNQLQYENKKLQLIVDYKINLQLQIAKNLQKINIVVNSKQKIEQLKGLLQRQCNIDKKLQKWQWGGIELSDQKSFQCQKIYQCNLKIDVTEILNLQYYGFSTQEDKIKTNIYTNFYVQNDIEFQKQIQQSKFPQKDYQYQFRTKALSKIFSVIKKHCRIKTAIDSIKSIVANSSKSCKLWKPTNSSETTLFNENYILFNIVNTSQDQLITQMFRTYKNHSPLPLRTRNLKGQVKNLGQIHYWICTKSMNIVSLEIKGAIKGKSTFLNQIFKTDFQTKLKHPICQRTAFIKYDIYRNIQYKVDLIDVSTDALNQQQKIQLCKYANILIIHLLDKDIKQVNQWVEKYCKDIPIIYCYRDSDQIKNQFRFKTQIQQNNNSNLLKNYHLPQMNQANIIYYQYGIRQISNQINTFIIQVQSKLCNQKRWLLNNYFQKSSQRLNQYTEKLKKLQSQFSTIVNLNLLTKSIPQKQKQNIQISQTISQLININQYNDISNFMSKMKQFSRNQRNKNLAPFTSNIQKLKNILQKKATKSIQMLESQISQCFKQLNKINSHHKTQKFIEGQRIYQLNRCHLTYQILQDILKKYLQPQFQDVIKKKDFSIENFWRILVYIYSLNQQITYNKSIQKIKSNILGSALRYFSIQFQRGKTTQLINGDTLEMPIKLFKQHEKNFESKNIMVIGVVGIQSSGKSTLLNFLFGCDFLSSQGRCTSGVYSTYYDIRGQNIPGCDGILVLDTQGLFSNHQRNFKQGHNFDNKLVLFLLKVCDILIVNNRGDVSVNIQDILQLSFQSELLQYEIGRRYPHFHVVLNMKTDGMSIQNMREIAKLRQKIVQSNVQMQKYFSSEDSSALPIAFSSKDSKGVATFIHSIQSTNKVASTQFYEDTRELSLELIAKLTQRGQKTKNRNSFARKLGDIYLQFDSTWNTLIHRPILTKHLNKKLKKFDEKIQNFICKINQQLDRRYFQLSQQIPNQIIQIDEWNLRQVGLSTQYKKEVLKKFQQQFMNKDIETNNLAKLSKMQLQVKISSYQTNLKLQITQKKYKLALSQSKNKGINDLNKKARSLRIKSLTQQQKLRQFSKSWENYTQDIIKKIDPRRNSKQIWHNIQLFYNQHINNFNKIKLDNQDYEVNSSQDFNNYYNLKQKQFIRLVQDKNYLQSINSQPIIALSQQEVTDLNYHYFDMKKFFQLVPTRFEYYINYINLGEFLNNQTREKKIQIQIRKSPVIQGFIDLLSNQLKNLGAKINQNQFKRLKDILVETFFKRVQNPNYKQAIIEKNTLIITKPQITKQKIQEIQKENEEKEQKQKQIKKNKNKNNSKEQIEKDHKQQKSFEYKKVNNILQNCKLITKQEILYSHLQTKSRLPIFVDYLPMIKLLGEIIIRKYVELNLNLFIETFSNLRETFIKQSFEQLWKIGIYPKSYYIYNIYKYNVNVPNICIDACQFNAIQILNKNQIFQEIDSMSDLIHKDKLRKMIQDKKFVSSYKIPYKKSQCIAYSNEKKIQIVPSFSNNKFLLMYKDKQYSSLIDGIRDRQFLNLVKKNINFTRILIQIKKAIQKIPNQVKIQSYVQQISIVIKNELQEFNKDLRQISQVVSMDFKFLIHDITKRLIWKKLEIQRFKQNKKTQEKLKKDQQQQRQIFYGILNKNSKSSCYSNAIIFITAYKLFIESYFSKQKEKFFNDKQSSFLAIHTREFLQNHIDSEMVKEKTKDKLMKYLNNPAEILNNYYNDFIQKEIQKFNTDFTCKSWACFNQLKTIINNMQSKLIGGSQLVWQVDSIFQDSFVQSQKSQKNQLGLLLKDVFRQILIHGQKITCSYKNNFFKIKQGIQIDIISPVAPVVNHINDAFLDNLPQFQIFNLSIFIQKLSEQIKILQSDLNSLTKFNEDDFNQFRQKVKLTLCQVPCPCCDKLCDVDMRLESHHTIHHIHSGHQMRAIKGIVVQKKKKDTVVKYASVLRCQDLHPLSTFKYYNKEYMWQDFVQDKKNEWNFKSKQSNTKLFMHIWNICGETICQNHTNNGRQMTYIPYADGTIQFIQSNDADPNNPQNIEFIFAIDGSGSMQGEPWDNQLKQLKKMLQQISYDSTNSASILVFSNHCKVLFQNVDPKKIDVDQIDFPDGGTDPNPAFLQAAQIIRKVNSKLSKNAFFVYISDGQASHPASGIQALLKCRKQLEKKNLTLKYSSILIKDDESESIEMQLINKQMGGKSQYVPSVKDISQKFKEILQNNIK